VLGGSVPAAFPRSARCPSMAVEERPADLLLLSEYQSCTLPALYGTLGWDKAGRPTGLLGWPQPALHEPEGGVEGNSYTPPVE
jgi:hypothetical protein